MYKVTIETSEQNLQNNFASPPLLSELFIKLPKPQSSPRKPSLMFAYQDEYQESPHQYQIQTPHSKKIDSQNHFSIKSDSNCFIFSGTRTKNSSASLPFRSQSEIITQWVRALFQKKGLLGIHWQQKFKYKRKKELKEAFIMLKQSVEGQFSAQLKTQSLYKPQARRMNKLLGLGCDKMLQILPKIINRNCQSAFSKVLRFRAFKHLTNQRSRNQQKSINSNHPINKSLKASTNNNLTSRKSKELQNINNHNHFNVYPNQRNVFRNQDQQAAKSRQLKQATSLKHLNFNPNQYIMRPTSPNVHQTNRIFEEKKVIINLNQVQLTNQQKFIQVRESPNVNSTYKTHINKEYIPLQNSRHMFFNINAPSPKTHHFTPFAHQNFVTSPQNIDIKNSKNKNPIKILSFDNIRQCKTRPHSHTPFTSKKFSKQALVNYNIESQKIENRKSRAMSSSPNIKISFIAQQITPNPHQLAIKQKMNDYEAEINLRNNKNLYKLGTLENRQMRQSYQVNSIQNQLVSQGQYQFRINQPISYTFYSPVSPKAMPNVIQFQNIRVDPPSPTNQYIYKTQQPLRQQKSRPSLRIEPNDYYMKKREKILVTTSNKRNY